MLEDPIQCYERAGRSARPRRGHWRIAETTPGTWDVQNCENLSRYAVWLYPEHNRWACSCPDFTGGMAYHLGLHCKHIEAVRLCLPQLMSGIGAAVEWNMGMTLPAGLPATALEAVRSVRERMEA